MSSWLTQGLVDERDGARQCLGEMVRAERPPLSGHQQSPEEKETKEATRPVDCDPFDGRVRPLGYRIRVQPDHFGPREDG